MCSAAGALAVLYAGLMVVFTASRKLGSSWWIMPHSGVVGVATGWTIVSQGAAALGLEAAQSLAPGAPWHLARVVVPQQACYVATLALRSELVGARLPLMLAAWAPVLAAPGSVPALVLAEFASLLVVKCRVLVPEEKAS